MGVLGRSYRIEIKDQMRSAAETIKSTHSAGCGQRMTSLPTLDIVATVISRKIPGKTESIRWIMMSLRDNVEKRIGGSRKYLGR